MTASSFSLVQSQLQSHLRRRILTSAKNINISGVSSSSSETSLSMVRTRGLEKREEGATPLRKFESFLFLTSSSSSFFVPLKFPCSF